MFGQLHRNEKTCKTSNDKSNFNIVDQAESVGIVADPLSASKVNLNWTAFEKYGTQGGPLTEERKQYLATHVRAYYYDNNPWKFADAYFDKVKFKDKILSLIGKISNMNKELNT